MISRRDKLLNYPFELQRYEQHRQKVHSAKPAVDMRTPPSYAHVVCKPKKVQTEKERLRRIEAENLRLLQKLGAIMQTKRLTNIWTEPRPNFLGREKLFETRPHSTLPKLIAVYAASTAPSTLRDWQESPFSPLRKSPLGRTSQRCPTCTGRPERMLLRIPETRIPWPLPRKSWNVRAQEFCPPRCLHCGHAKEH